MSEGSPGEAPSVATDEVAGPLTWMWQRRRFGLKVTAVSFVFTAAIMFSLAVLQEAIHGGGSQVRVGGVSLPFPAVDGDSQVLILFAVAVLTWVLLLSMSQLVVARQVRGYLRGAARHTARPNELMQERLLVEAYLGGLSIAARALALSLVLAYLLPPLAAVGVFITALVVAAVSLRRYRGAVSLHHRWRRVTGRARTEGGSGGARAFAEGFYERDVYLHRLPFGQLLAIVGTILILVVLPAWVQGGATGGVSLLITLAWIQAILGVATTAGAFGWRWSGRMAPQSQAADRDWDDD